jgi:hypothetical protein
MRTEGENWRRCTRLHPQPACQRRLGPHVVAPVKRSRPVSAPLESLQPLATQRIDC